MASLIILVLFSFLVAFFATENISTVDITLAGYIFRNIPLYVVVLGALLTGIIISWLIHLASSFSHSLTIHDKESEIKNAAKEIKELKKENEALKVEIAHLKGRNEEESGVAKELHRSHRPSILDRFRASFG